MNDSLSNHETEETIFSQDDFLYAFYYNEKESNSSYLYDLSTILLYHW